MASKIDPFFTTVFEQLNARGNSYRSVCNHLLLHGVEISPQALRSWHLRRSQKIKERNGSQLPPPPIFEKPEGFAPESLEPPEALRKNKSTPPRQAVRPTSTPHQVTDLEEAIDRQQQFLANNPFSLGTANFPIQRKR